MRIILGCILAVVALPVAAGSFGPPALDVTKMASLWDLASRINGIQEGPDGFPTDPKPPIVEHDFGAHPAGKPSAGSTYCWRECSVRNPGDGRDGCFLRSAKESTDALGKKCTCLWVCGGAKYRFK